MAIDDMAKQASAGGESEVKFLTPLDINTKSEKKYCRFKKYGIKHVDYKDADFLLPVSYTHLDVYKRQVLLQETLIQLH